MLIPSGAAGGTVLTLDEPARFDAQRAAIGGVAVLWGELDVEGVFGVAAQHAPAVGGDGAVAVDVGGGDFCRGWGNLQFGATGFDGPAIGPVAADGFDGDVASALDGFGAGEIQGALQVFGGLPGAIAFDDGIEAGRRERRENCQDGNGHHQLDHGEALAGVPLAAPGRTGVAHGMHVNILGDVFRFVPLE